MMKGSGRYKNLRILQIRIHNTASKRFFAVFWRYSMLVWSLGPETLDFKNYRVDWVCNKIVSTLTQTAPGKHLVKNSKKPNKIYFWILARPCLQVSTVFATWPAAVYMYQQTCVHLDHLDSTQAASCCWILFFYVPYSTLLHQPPLRFHCVGGCWDRTQDCCDFDIDSQTL